MFLLELLKQDPFLAFVFLLAIVVAITVHEFAHAWTAYRLGDDTPHLMGRVSLSPGAHLDPVGSLLFLIAGFGWGKPVMYNPMRLQGKFDELIVALAGPASNLLLAIILNVVALLADLGGISPLPIQIAANVNVMLAAFNMLPIPPLDGSSIVAYFWPPYRSIMGGQIGLIVLLALIFLPAGNSSLLASLVNPIISGFMAVSNLFGLLGSTNLFS